MITLPEGADTRALLLGVLETYDSSRDRSTQTLPGASSLGGCRRQTFYRMVEFPESNSNISRLAAIKGTAIHKYIEQAFEYVDPSGERFLSELTVPGYPGMGDAHIDLYDKERCVITDWKTTQKKNLRYFPKQAQRWQVQVYGWCATQAGYPVESVELCCIPLDGSEEDIRLHSEPYSEEVAAEGFTWLGQVTAMRDNGELPPADFSGVICEKHCPYFGPDSCGGK